MSHMIIEIVKVIGTCDPSRYVRLVTSLLDTLSLCSFTSCWSDWHLAEDTARLFVREVTQECFLIKVECFATPFE
jgi:hypothetical protein